MAEPGGPKYSAYRRTCLAAISFWLLASLVACHALNREATPLSSIPGSEELPEFPFPSGVILYRPDAGTVEARTLSGALAGELKIPDWENAGADTGFPVGPFLQPGDSFRFAYLRPADKGLDLSIRTSTGVWQVVQPPLIPPLASDPSGRLVAFSRFSTSDPEQVELYAIDLFTLEGIRHPLATSRLGQEGMITPLAIEGALEPAGGVYVCWRKELEGNAPCRGLAYFDRQTGDRVDLVRQGDDLLALSPDLHWCLLQASDTPRPAVRLRHLDDGAEVVYSSLMAPGIPVSASLSPTGSRMTWLVTTPNSGTQANLILGGPAGAPPRMLSFPGTGAPDQLAAGQLLPRIWLDDRHLLLSTSGQAAPRVFLLDAESGSISTYTDGVLIGVFYNRP
jgi:hypothetical protein